MATAFFGTRGVTVARNLLKAENAGLNRIVGGGLPGYHDYDEFELVWENYGFGLKTTNSMTTGNAMIFQYPAGSASTIRNLVLSDSPAGLKALTLVLQTGTIQSDTIKFLREIVITLDVVQSA